MRLRTNDVIIQHGPVIIWKFDLNYPEVSWSGSELNQSIILHLGVDRQAAARRVPRGNSSPFRVGIWRLPRRNFRAGIAVISQLICCRINCVLTAISTRNLPRKFPWISLCRGWSDFRSIKYLKISWVYIPWRVRIPTRKFPRGIIQIPTRKSHNSHAEHDGRRLVINNASYTVFFSFFSTH